MKCQKCGFGLNENDKFCASCGAPVVKEEEPKVKEVNNTKQDNNFVGSQNNNVNANNNNYNNQQFNSMPVNNVKRTSGGTKALIIVAIILFVLVILGVGGYFIYKLVTSSNMLVCESNEGNITIIYNDKTLLGYTAERISYDLDQQKKVAETKGTDYYAKEFNKWFITNTSGTCKIVGKNANKVVLDDRNNNVNNNNYNNNNNNNNNNYNYNNNNNNNNVVTNTDNIVVGSDKFGYVDVPKNWVKFFDPDAPSVFQYSYAGVYIITLNTMDNSHTAKEYASNYLYNKQNSKDVTDVEGATVTIGRDRSYTAYQVYMYYPGQSSYLITYFFETEDGNVRYMALEGPGKLNDMSIYDFLFIPKSFRLSK